jgi:uncharacterized protein YfkK (UPF0435 family)
MDLSVKSNENMEYMLEEIKNKLQVVNRDVIKSTHLDPEKYEDMKDLYQLVMKMGSFSLKEIDGILSELKSLKKN